MALVVRIGAEEEVVSEMRVDEPELGVIMEMVTDPVKLDKFIPGLGAKGKAIAEMTGDDSPEFPIVRIEEGWSDNGRLWDGQELVSIAEQVSAKEPVGHWGHIKEENLGWEAPVPQTTWLGAITKDEGSTQKDRKGKIVKVFYAAGYNLPSAPIRTYIKSRAVKGVSWLGKARQIPIPGKGVQMRDFRLIALDWARKGAEGMPTTSIVGVAAEMEKGDQVSDKALSQVTPEEFKKENPNGYALLVSEVTAEKDDQIAEMQKDKDTAKKDVDLLTQVCEALGIDKDKLLETVTALKSKTAESAKAAFDKALEKVLAEKVPDEKQRTVVRGLLPVAEMVDQMAEKVKPDDDEDKHVSVVGEMVTTEFDSNEAIKVFVSEMSGGGQNIARRTELRSGSSKDKVGGAGSSMSRVTVIPGR